MNCPNCDTIVENSRINVYTDIGKCQNCNHIFKVSEGFIAHKEQPNELENFDLNNPPDGNWFRYEMNRLIVGASAKSKAAFFLIPFMIIWSGGSLGGIYGTQYFNNEFDLTLSLFGLPFLAGAVFFWGIALMAIAGKVELSIGKYDGYVFTGIGKLGIKKTFNWEDINDISLKESRGRNGKSVYVITLLGKKRISFGSGLKEERKSYLYQALKSIYNKIKEGRNIY